MCPAQGRGRRRKILQCAARHVIKINMHISLLLPTQSNAAPELVRRLGQILAGLAALVAARFLRRPHLAGLTVILWNRLSRSVQRFARVMTRPGRAPAPVSRPGRRAYGRQTVAALPRGHGWLVRELGYEAMAFGGQLEALLAEPAMQAALAALPGAGRVLRPLCRMLGVPVAAVKPVPLQVQAVGVPSGSTPSGPNPTGPTQTGPNPTGPTQTGPNPSDPTPSCPTRSFSSPLAPIPAAPTPPTATRRVWPKSGTAGAERVEEKCIIPAAGG